MSLEKPYGLFGFKLVRSLILFLASNIKPEHTLNTFYFFLISFTENKIWDSGDCDF